ncbi:Dak1-domain-containing protein [Hesseltinella vesiculosa]|uniref:Dak1-domain-containing protein n=1 Tax=Hesseltinella vesiculosa TaxID=101127 RepID=A0A1X2GQ65_9FUNG|nr:Dak1-domain-containing protein [Hesseltinella vesiculosa]
MTKPQGKHFMNASATIVQDSLQGLCYARPHLKLLADKRVVYAANVDQVAKAQVTLISGGGSGHEGAFAGFVGDGLLTAAVCGGVFASPSASQVLAALERVQSPNGVLVVVMNYTGDCLHFGLAVERAKAKGIRAKLLVVKDDLASRNTRVGSRGMAATAMVIKICGAMAAQGASLDELVHVGQEIMNHSATLGVALDHCHVPGSSSHVTLAPGEMELGMGIHNEAGIQKLPWMPAKNLVDLMVDRLLCPETSNLVAPEDKVTKVVLMVNNYGGTPLLEFNVIIKEAVEAIHRIPRLQLERVLPGCFVTSLNMPGFSLSLLTIPDDKDAWLDDLDSPVQVSGWPRLPSFGSMAILGTQPTFCLTPLMASQDQASVSGTHDVLEKVLRTILTQLKAIEPTVTSYDTVLGDGDLGASLLQAADAIEKNMAKITQKANVSDALLSLADIIDHHVGGTASAIYCIYLNALANALAEQPEQSAVTSWMDACASALTTLEKYTQARVGDRTMMDTLIPFVTTWQKTKSFENAVTAAQQGMFATIKQKPALGRTAYLSEDTVLKANMPDAGAFALSSILDAIHSSLGLDE